MAMSSTPVEAAVEPKEEQPVRSWDITSGPRKEGMLERLSMLPPATVKFVTNTVYGGPMLLGGYATGKVTGLVTGRKAIDSSAFRLGVNSWMLANGIMPEVVYEPVDGTTPSAADQDIRQAPLLIANHTSYLDGLILAACLDFPRVVAMSGTRKVPVVGRLMEEMDCVFVDRSSSASRKNTQEAISQHCESWTPGSRPLLIFPEATTTNGETVKELKHGAFNAGMPVRPAILVYTGQWDPASTTFKATDSGLQKLSDAEWAAQFVGNWVHSVHVRVLAPYMPSPEEKQDPALYSHNCREYMAAALARVRKELQDASWKTAVGRESGGLGYRFGDISRKTVNTVMGACTSASHKTVSEPVRA